MVRESATLGIEEKFASKYSLDSSLGGDEDAALPQWIQRQHSKTVIDRAGELLASDAGIGEMDFIEAYKVVLNWRTSHAMPLLTFRISLTKRAHKVESTSIVAQRLKRFSSIVSKLEREPNMKLSQMQDLGGCRAIMSDIGALFLIHELYREAHDDFVQSPNGMKCFNYLVSPKRDGYRGIHLVGRYSAQAQKNEPWNGHRIEIQLRTRLQHAFATAVETVATFTRSTLKTRRRLWRVAEIFFTDGIGAGYSRRNAPSQWHCLQSGRTCRRIA